MYIYRQTECSESTIKGFRSSSPPRRTSAAMEEKNTWGPYLDLEAQALLEAEFFSRKRQGIIMLRSHPSSKAIQKMTQALWSE